MFRTNYRGEIMQTDSVWVSIAVEESRELLARLKREQWIETMGCAVILGIMRYFRMGDGIMIIIAFLAGVSIVCSQIQIVGALTIPCFLLPQWKPRPNRFA